MQTGMGVAAGAGKLPFFLFFNGFSVEMAVLSHISF
jgi:hypothetical protein